jgi:hypothetical protein
LILHNITSDYLGQHISELKNIGKKLLIYYLSIIKESWIIICCTLVTIFTVIKVCEWTTLGWFEILMFSIWKLLSMIKFVIQSIVWRLIRPQVKAHYGLRAVTIYDAADTIVALIISKCNIFYCFFQFYLLYIILVTKLNIFLFYKFIARDLNIIKNYKLKIWIINK